MCLHVNLMYLVHKWTDDAGISWRYVVYFQMDACKYFVIKYLHRFLPKLLILNDGEGGMLTVFAATDSAFRSLD